MQRAANTLGKRAFHDLVTIQKGNARKPVVSQGVPGYSAVTGHVVTVFGATGFLGRYLVSKLGRMGTQVIVAYRDEDEKRRLKPMGDLGQIVPMEWDMRNDRQTAECLKHSDMVFNLVGRNYETKNFSYTDVHSTGAERMATIAREHGVPRFVHLSHLNSSLTSPSKFYQTKAEGELRVQEAFPNATIVKPSVMYGYEDRFLTNMNVFPIWWKLNDGQTKCRPVHVMDVAQALTNLVPLPTLARTINLPGPSTLTHNYVLDLISSLTFNPPSRAPVVPKAIAKILADITSRAVWWPTISADEVVRRYIDDVDVPGDWDAVGVTPAEIEQHAIAYVRRFRSGPNYGRPVVFPGRPVGIESL